MNYNKLSLVTYDNDKNKDFKENIFNNLKSSSYMFSEIKRIKESTLKEYLKIFIYKDNTVMPVAPTSYLPKGYFERVKFQNAMYIDKNNKTILLIEL